MILHAFPYLTSRLVIIQAFSITDDLGYISTSHLRHFKPPITWGRKFQNSKYNRAVFCGFTSPLGAALIRVQSN